MLTAAIGTGRKISAAQQLRQLSGGTAGISDASMPPDHPRVELARTLTCEGAAEDDLGAGHCAACFCRSMLKKAPSAGSICVLKRHAFGTLSNGIEKGRNYEASPGSMREGFWHT